MLFCIIIIFFIKNIKYRITSSFSISLNNTLISSLVFYLFSYLGILNLFSLMIFSYPVTTTLSFNLSMAFFLWITRILILSLKKSNIRSLVPSNSPWYLSPFLSLIELVRISVRPITLCFRLLANIRAGHILLSLICKIPYLLWLLGSLFGLLELMVSVVQSFVFLILIRVYLRESISH